MMGQEDISQDSSDSTKNSKDAFFDPKPKPKMIRVLTVLAYVLSVSIAAIFLSIYYIFMWHGEPHLGAHKNMPNNYYNRSPVNNSKVIEAVRNRSNNTFAADFNQEEKNTTIGDTYTSLNEDPSQACQSGGPTGPPQLMKTEIFELLEFNFDNKDLKSISVALILLKNLFNFLTEKMSNKATNGIKLTMSDSLQWKSGSLLDTSVKFAGEEAKDRLYEPKHKKKLVRVLTVVAYVFFVSLAAIMLSLYYVFIWNGDKKMAVKYVTRAPTADMYYAQNCKNLIADMQQQFTTLEFDENLSFPTHSENITATSTINWQDDYNDSLESIKKSSMLIQKLWSEEKYEDNY